MQENSRSGFSLIELLVVLLIFAILVSIAVPTLISQQPQRNLAAASERFAGDLNYCRAKAESTGNNVYMGFIYSDDSAQIDNGLDAAGVLVDGTATAGGELGSRFDPPMNPGVSRVAKSYYIVEERPRNYDNGTPLDYKDDRPMTYLDYLLQYDRWDAGNKATNTPPHPVEPRYPFDATKTLTLPEPERGGFNRVAAPLCTYPLNMLAGNGTNYSARFVGEANIADWSDPMAQQYKTFCVADDQEIAGDGGFPGYDVDGDRRYTPGVDNPRLKDLVYDYVLLKRVDLPEHVSFLNPWRSQWVVGNEGGAQPYTFGTFQFLQFLVSFSPKGEVNLAQWGYDPPLFPQASAGNNDSLVHGSVVLLSSVPEPKTIFMVIDETVYGGDGFAGDVRDVRKSTQTECGRVVLLWPLNGKYYVDDYAPKDHDHQLVNGANDLRLDLTQSNVTGNVRSAESDSTGATKAVAREFGYSQDFLDNPNLAPSAVD